MFMTVCSVFVKAGATIHDVLDQTIVGRIENNAWRFERKGVELMQWLECRGSYLIDIALPTP